MAASTRDLPAFYTHSSFESIKTSPGFVESLLERLQHRLSAAPAANRSCSAAPAQESLEDWHPAMGDQPGLGGKTMAEVTLTFIHPKAIVGSATLTHKGCFTWIHGVLCMLEGRQGSLNLELVLPKTCSSSLTTSARISHTWAHIMSGCWLDLNTHTKSLKGSCSGNLLLANALVPECYGLKDRILTLLYIATAV